jgi:hypothetical protein
MIACAYRALVFAIVVMLASVPAHAAADASSAAAPGEAANEAPIACKTDAECPHLACGPCTAGMPITQSMINGPECAVNPCLDASAVCNAQHVCEIGPRTRKNPAVWKKR